jgi:hypothetical protein
MLRLHATARAHASHLCHRPRTEREHQCGWSPACEMPPGSKGICRRGRAMMPGAGATVRGPAGETAPVTQNFTAVIEQSGPWWIGWIEEVPGRQLPGTNPGGTARDARGHAARGPRAEPSRGARRRRRHLRGSPDRHMKREALLRSGDTAACCCARAVGIHGGTILSGTSARRFRGTPRSTTICRARFARTSEFPGPREPGRSAVSE